jgi:hypothetical protein
MPLNTTTDAQNDNSGATSSQVDQVDGKGKTPEPPVSGMTVVAVCNYALPQFKVFMLTFDCNATQRHNENTAVHFLVENCVLGPIRSINILKR